MLSKPPPDIRADTAHALVNIDAEGKETVFFLDDYRPKTKGLDRHHPDKAHILHSRAEGNMYSDNVYRDEANFNYRSNEEIPLGWLEHLERAQRGELTEAEALELRGKEFPEDKVQELLRIIEQNNAAKTSPFPLIWAGDTQPVIQETMIRGLIKPETMIVTYGESGAGKSFHTLDRDLCLATGKPWYGRETERGFVLYVAAEGPHSIQNRVFAYRNRYLKDVRRIPFAIMPKAVNLRDPNAHVDNLIDFIKEVEDENGIKCVKVTADTLLRVLHGNNNDPKDMGDLINNADRIRHKIGCAFEFDHHQGKDPAKGAMGHTSLRAAIDTEIRVAQDETGLRTAEVVKQRDLPEGDTFPFRLEVVTLGTDNYGYPVTTCVPVWETRSRREAPPGKGEKDPNLIKLSAAIYRLDIPAGEHVSVPSAYTRLHDATGKGRTWIYESIPKTIPEKGSQEARIARAKVTWSQELGTKTAPILLHRELPD